jgi:glycine/D-amino acid oxidase-like deaminating enzyme
MPHLKNSVSSSTHFPTKSISGNSFMSYQYQVVVIGSGSAGKEACLAAAKAGLRTLLVEERDLGGTSFHRGSYAVRALWACASYFKRTEKASKVGTSLDLIETSWTDWMTAQSKWYFSQDGITRNYHSFFPHHPLTGLLVSTAVWPRAARSRRTEGPVYSRGHCIPRRMVCADLRAVHGRARISLTARFF